MEEAEKIFDYLPIVPPDDEYIKFLWDTFQTNYSNEKYQFALMAYHMLFMCYVYYQIGKIYIIEPERCRDLMIFTGKVQNHIDDHETKVSQKKNSPLYPLQKFSLENERTIMGLFLSIGCNKEDIKQLRSIVDCRNDIAHSNGNILYKNRDSYEQRVSEILACIENLQEKSKSLIETAYKTFLISSCRPEEREFIDDESQVSEVLVQGNYFSMADVKVVMKWDISVLSIEFDYQNVCSLDGTLKRLYSENE